MDDFAKFNLDEISLEKDGERYDISTRTLELKIDESVTSPYMSGRIEIIDFADELGRLDMDGTERVNVSLKSIDREEFIEFSLAVSKVFAASEDDLKKKNVVVSLVSPEFLAGATATVGRGFVNRKVSEMAKMVFDESLATDKRIVTCHESDKKMDIVVPKCNFWETMEMLCDCAYNDSAHQTSLFFFGETRDGYHFVNLEELIEDLHNTDAEWPRYLFRSDARAVRPGGSRQDIINKTLSRNNDFRERIHSGIHRADTKTISILDRTYRERPFDSRTFVGETFTSTEPEHPGLIDTDGLLDAYATTPTRVYSMFSYPDWSANGIGSNFHTYTPKRLFYQRVMAHSSMGIDILGDSDLKPMTLVDIVVPRLQIQEDPADSEEIYLPGRYLVAGISHNVNVIDNVYTQTLSIMRDSLLDNQDRTDIGGSRKGIRSRDRRSQG